MEDEMTASGNPAEARNEGRDRRLAAEVERRLADEAGIYVAVRVSGGVAYLDGMVETVEQQEAASDLAQGVEGITRVENNLEVEEFDIAEPSRRISSDAHVESVDYQMLEGSSGEQPDQFEVDPDFNQPIPSVGADVTDDAMVAVEEGVPYVPPTDPVVRPALNDDSLEVVGGFGTTAMDEFPDDLQDTALGDAPPGDEDLEAQVLEALAADALTTDLLVQVTARRGVVRLRGRVPTLDDAEAAEEVAGRVPGVREVIEELNVDAMER
jgi:osmotically-inducible protein OsmY